MFIFCFSSDFSFHYLGKLITEFAKRDDGYYFYYLSQDVPNNRFYHVLVRYFPEFFKIKLCRMIEEPYYSVDKDSLLFLADIVEKDKYTELQRWAVSKQDLIELDLSHDNLLQNVLRCTTLQKKQLQLDNALALLRKAVPLSQITKDTLELMESLNSALQERLAIQTKEVGVYGRVKEGSGENKGESENVKSSPETEKETV